MNWAAVHGVATVPAWFHLVVMAVALLVLFYNLAKDGR